MASDKEIKEALENAIEVVGNYDASLTKFATMVDAVQAYATLAGLDYEQAFDTVGDAYRAKVDRLNQRKK